jgi:excisionase family DNA binding protein
VPYVSIPEAARRLAASESTIRRKIKAGELHAVQEETIQGYRWLVEVAGDQVLSSDDQVPTISEQVATDAQLATTETDELSSSNQPLKHREQVIIDGDQVLTTDEQVTTSNQVGTSVELVQELRRLHDQNVQLAGQVGYLQAQLQDAREQIRLLTDTEHTTAQADQPPARPIPWWRRLLGQ